jgi:hypothetical protein
MQSDERNAYLWFTSEILYYFGLVLFVGGIPALTFILWAMHQVHRADPNFTYLFVAWLVSGAMFASGILLKNRLIK